MSATFNVCEKEEHKRTRESPNGIDIMEHCETCEKTWMVKGGTGEIIYLFGYYQRWVNRKGEK